MNLSGNVDKSRILSVFTLGRTLESHQFQQVLSGIEGKSKENLILQVADLCLYPVAKSKEQPENQAFRALVNHKKLIDTALAPEALKEMGVKYCCFDTSL